MAWTGATGHLQAAWVTPGLAFLQPGPQRLAGLVELADIIYEDLQLCYGVYASLFHG
jgi:hypothetical protein